MTRKNADIRCRRVRECHEALFEDAVTHRIIGAFYEVYRNLGYGFVESIYARALEIELTARNLHVARQVATEVRFKGQIVGVFRADMLVESRVVLELKASRRCDGSDIAELSNYLRASDLELGLLLHFGPRASFKRLIASTAYARRARPRSSARSAPTAAALFPDNAVALTPLTP